jgi:hypothetical protein
MRRKAERPAAVLPGRMPNVRTRMVAAENANALRVANLDV